MAIAFALVTIVVVIYFETKILEIYRVLIGVKEALEKISETLRMQSKLNELQQKINEELYGREREGEEGAMEKKGEGAGGRTDRIADEAL